MNMETNAEFALHFCDFHTNPNRNLCAIVYVVIPGALCNGDD